MKLDISLIDDHQQLIPFATHISHNGSQLSLIPLDAIFIPFRDNFTYANSLLLELQWYEGPIYLMPSDHYLMHNENIPTNKNVKIIDATNSDIYNFFNDLLTSKNKHSTISNTKWDLPFKRNFALWFSRKNHFEKILLVDDDIRGLEPSLLQEGSNYLDKYILTGCFVEDFPDTSVVGHLELLAGVQVKCFLSGSFLFIKTSCINGFFPYIYNEDWIFMLYHILDRQTFSMGNIKQMPYDPFKDPDIPIFQEFGEIIAEGLFALLHLNLLSHRLNANIWMEIIHKRKQELMLLKDVRLESPQQESLDNAIKTIQQINATDCITFIKNWENDIIAWNNFLKETT